MNHGQYNYEMATRTETTHELTYMYSMARAIDITRMAIC